MWAKQFENVLVVHSTFRSNGTLGFVNAKLKDKIMYYQQNEVEYVSVMVTAIEANLRFILKFLKQARGGGLYHPSPPCSLCVPAF